MQACVLAALFGCLGKPARDLGDEAVVLGEAEHVIDVVLLAQLIAREPGVRAQQDAHIGPASTDLRNDPRHLFDRAGAGIDIGSVQLGTKQMPSAENIQRQIATGFVVAVKEEPFLPACSGSSVASRSSAIRSGAVRCASINRSTNSRSASSLILW